MGQTKNTIFTQEQNDLAEVAKAIAHPARIAIIELLAEKQDCICGDIVNEIGLAQATVSQHLKELKKVNIIKGEIEGRNVCYCINTERMEEIKLLLHSFLDINTSKCC
jgi:ArsR family transcriptional regulator